MQILQTIWTALTTENEVILNITGIPFCFIEAYISMLIFTKIFNISTKRNSKIIYILWLSSISYTIRFFIPDPYSTFINFITCPILISIIFKVNPLISIFSEIIPIFLLAIIDFLYVKFFSLFNISSYELINIPLYRIICSIIEYISMYFIYLFLLKKDITLEISSLTNKKQTTIIFANALLGILTICLQTYIFIFHINALPIKIVLFSTISLISYFFISLYSVVNTNKLNIAKQNLEETRLMNKTLTILNDKIRAFRHDFNNIIQALGGYIQAKDIDGLEKYYSQLLKDCQEVNNLTGLNPESINNPAIYSLIASKYYLATEKGIEFDLDIFMDLNSIDMKIYEFCRILGILLDNAIQATQECEEKQITVTIRKDNRCKRQLLIVENTYKEKDIDTEKIFEKGYSTKEGNTGLGLWEVRQILLKNTNLNLFTSKDDTYFKQQLEIYKS